MSHHNIQPDGLDGVAVDGVVTGERAAGKIRTPNAES